MCKKNKALTAHIIFCVCIFFSFPQPEPLDASAAAGAPGRGQGHDGGGGGGRGQGARRCPLGNEHKSLSFFESEGSSSLQSKKIKARLKKVRLFF